VGLGLESDSDVLDGTRDDGVGDAGEGSGEVVLRVGEAGVERCFGGVVGFQAAAGFVESTKLDGDTGADADKGSEGAFVES